MTYAGSDRWQVMRDEMPIARNWAYLDHAAVAPLSAPTARAMRDWIHQAAEQADTIWPQWKQRVADARRLAAQLMAADEDEIALVPNTTAGINLVAEGIPWQLGDNVVLLANEFPSNQYPWLNQIRRGVEVRRVPVVQGRLDMDALAALVDDQTRILACSWVGFASGFRCDPAALAELAHDHQAYVFLDAIQGLGVFPLDVHRCGVDFLAADGHKWIMGPEGAGIFYVRHGLLEQLVPLGVGWNSVQQGSDYDRIELNLRPAAARYEGGSQNMVGMTGLATSLEFLLNYGAGPEQSAIGNRVLEVTDLACELLQSAGATVLSDRDPEHASGIVWFDFPGVPLRAARKLCEATAVVLSVRSGHLRISPHAYNNRDDLESLIAALRHAASE